MINFDLAFTYLLGSEGLKYTNDPRDPGGPTKFGVTLAAYEDFMGAQASAEDIEHLTTEDAKVFYLQKYWQPMSCDRVESAAIGIALLDTGVLYGPGTCGILCQKALNKLCGTTLKLDGIIGDKTIELLNHCQDADFLAAFRSSIQSHIDRVISAKPKLEIFRRGWMNRANRLLTLTNLNFLMNEMAAQKGVQ